MFNKNNKNNISINEVEHMFNKFSDHVRNSSQPSQEFKKELNSKIGQARILKPEKIKKGHDFGIFKKNSFAYAVAAVVLAAVVGSALFLAFGNRQSSVVFAQDNFSLTATEEDSIGVSPLTSFVITSKEPVEASWLQERITVVPDIEYTLQKISERSFRIDFDRELPTDEIIKITLDTFVLDSQGTMSYRPYSWSYEVKGDFRIVNTIPANRTSSVPVDTGIEITFSSNQASNPDKYFEINPSVEGVFEQHRKVWVFVPKENLKQGVIYTATVKSGLTVVDSDETLGSDYVFQFETAGGGIYESGVGLYASTYQYTNPQSDAMISISIWEQDKATEGAYNATIYRINSEEVYSRAINNFEDRRWAYTATPINGISESEMPIVREYSNLPAQSIGDNSNQYLLQLPDKIEEGKYITKIEFNGKIAWVFLQSSQIAAHVQFADNSHAVWLNDAGTGNPIDGATVQYVGSDSHVVSNSDGLAMLETNDDYNLIRALYSGKSLFVIKQQEYSIYDYWYPWMQSGEYWGLIYTDKPLYQSKGDTIRFWGYIEKREDGSRPEKVEVALTNWQNVFAQKEIDVSSNGTFIGTIDFVNIIPSGYNLSMKINGEIIRNSNIIISEYVKPAYSITITPEKWYVWTDEESVINVSVKGFDGTPIKDMPINVSINDYPSGNKYEQVVTDASGNAVVKYIPKYFEFNENKNGSRKRPIYYPRSFSINARPEKAVEGYIEAYSNVFVYGPKISIQGSSFVNADTARIEVASYKVNPETRQQYNPEPAPQVSFTAEVYERVWERKEIGTSYDFFSKKTYKRYDWTDKTTLLQTIQGATDAAGKTLFSFPYKRNKNGYMYAKIIARDESGKTSTDEVGVFDYPDFQIPEAGEVRLINDDDPLGELNKRYDIGEEVNLRIVNKEGETYPVSDATRFLFIKAQNGIKETFVSKSPVFKFKYKKEDVPNVNVVFAVFDKSGYVVPKYMGAMYLMYNTDKGTLAMSVSTDKEQYKPGEQGRMQIDVKDVNGAPVSAEVLVRMVDEALFKIEDEYIDPVSSLFVNVSSGLRGTSTTLLADQSSLSEMTGAEGGGGGGETRSDFRDTALFETIKTGVDGKAELEFKLPHNITSWRISAIGLEPNKKLAGSIVKNISSSLPFSLSPVIKQTYLDSDKPKIVLRSFGADLNYNDRVEYTVEIKSVGFSKIAPAIAGEDLIVELPDLPEGEHEILIKGKSAVGEDAILRKIKIVSSYLQKPVISTQKVESGMRVAGSSDRPTEVIFADAGKGKYFSDLVYLAWNFGDRADQRIAAKRAVDILDKVYGNRDFENQEIETSLYQSSGIRLLPYSDSELELSAKVAMLNEHGFDEHILALYFTEVLNKSGRLNKEQKKISALEAAYAYLGLAAVGEPVLNEVKRFVAREDIGTDEKIVLALALDELGAKELAREEYRKIMSVYVIPGTDLDSLKGEREAIVERAALLSVLAASLNEPQADELGEFLEAYSKGEAVVLLERILFIERMLNNVASTPAKIAYNYNGKTIEVELENGLVHQIVAMPDALAQLNPQILQGGAYVTSMYQVPFAGLEQKTTEGLRISRHFENEKGETTNTFNSNEEIKVVIEYNIAKDFDGISFSIVDALPSGLIPASSSVSGSGFYGYSYEPCTSIPERFFEQLAYFHAFKSGRCKGKTAVIYKARAVTPGEYFAEPAVLRSNERPNLETYSNQEIITIQ
ncbi:MAG: hypothetical protein ACD_76C00027G0004 [uncultured bacterium]|nr:MAG: hypothetical protein ACD_76C00027G0004 [uncultured bacterium]HBD05230.1 hypothetical protein [Candidatus Uhrbacteria bacterium]